MQPQRFAATDYEARQAPAFGQRAATPEPQSHYPQQAPYQPPQSGGYASEENYAPEAAYQDGGVYGASQSYDAGRSAYDGEPSTQREINNYGHAARQDDFPDYFSAAAQNPAAPPDPREMHDQYFAAGAQPADYRGPARHGQPAVQRQDWPAPASAIDLDNGDLNAADEDWRGYGGESRLPARTALQSSAEEDLDADYFNDEEQFERENLGGPQPKKGGRIKLIAAVLAGAAVVGGGLAYGYKSFYEPSNYAEAPTVMADGGQVKEAPADPGGREFPNQTKKIYERLAMAEDTGGPQTATDDITTTSTGSLDERIEDALKQARKSGDANGPAPGRAANPDEPRLVPTEVYRPDGSRIAASGPSQNAAVGGFDGIAVSGAPEPAPKAQPAPPANAQPRQAPAARAFETTAPPAAAAPAPARPRIAAVAPPAAAPSGPGFYLQLKSSPDETRAMAELNDMQQKYSSVLGGYPLNTKAVEIPDKGTWYRTRVGPIETKDAANDLCVKLKGAGLKDCLVRAE